MVSISNHLRLFLAVSLSVCFLLHSLWLVFNTDTADFDFLEFGKFVGIPITVMLLAQFSRSIFLIIVRLTIITIFALLVVGIVGASIGLWSIFDETRLFIPLLGRGAGETAWALCALYVFLDYRQVTPSTISYFREVIYRLLTLIIIIMTESRVAILFMGIYIILRYQNVMFRTAVIGLPILLALSYSFFSNNDSLAIVSRTLSPEKILTGREYIWSAHVADFLRQPLTHILIGHDFSPKIVDVPEVGYLTADVHNLFFDFVRVYGLAGLIYFAAYLTIAKWSIQKEQQGIVWSGLVALLVMSLFVSVFRYPYLPLLTAIFLTLPFLGKPTIRHRELFLKNLQTRTAVCAGTKNRL